MKFKTNNAFNSTMITSFLPVTGSKNNKQMEKNMSLLQCLTNSHRGDGGLDLNLEKNAKKTSNYFLECRPYLDELGLMLVVLVAV